MAIYNCMVHIMHIRSYINQAFSACGVEVNGGQLLPYAVESGVTNQFFKLHCLAGNGYLIRLNGKLWPPFTREAENYNLNQLHENQIQTTVLHNDYERGFQICYELAGGVSFNKLCVVEKMPSLFYQIGYAIKKFHNIEHFQNTYSISDTIFAGYKRVINESDKMLLSKWMPLVMSLLAVIQADTSHMVASHNDLLPSSVYFQDDQVHFVDWEYSSMNHRAYDLALFSIKAGLSLEQEEVMLRAYGEQDSSNIYYEVAIIKPVLDYLFLLWHVTSKSPSLDISKKLVDILRRDLCLAEQTHVHYLRVPVMHGFFKACEQAERQNKEHRHKPIVGRACL